MTTFCRDPEFGFTQPVVNLTIYSHYTKINKYSTATGLEFYCSLNITYDLVKLIASKLLAKLTQWAHSYATKTYCKWKR